MLVDLCVTTGASEGLVMTDWFAVASTETSLRSGLDLEMPAPAQPLGDVVREAVAEGRVPEADLDAAVTRLLHAPRPHRRARRADAAGRAPQPPTAADVDLLRRRRRRLRALRQRRPPADQRRRRGAVAVIGEPAVSACIVGGGSAQVVQHHR